MNGTALHDELKRTSGRWSVAATAKVDGFVRERVRAAAALQGRRVVATAHAELAQRALVRFVQLLYDAGAGGRLYNVAQDGRIRIPVPWSRVHHADYGLTDRDGRILYSMVSWRLEQLPSRHQLMWRNGRWWILNLARFPTHDQAGAWLAQFPITPELWDEHAGKVPQRGQPAGRTGGQAKG